MHLCGYCGNTAFKPEKEPSKFVPYGELEVPGDDPGLLVVPGSVPGELEDLGGEVLHHGGHVDGGPGAHPLGVVSLPAMDRIKFLPSRDPIPPRT